MDTVKELNGQFWVFGIILTGICVIQAGLFLRLALKLNKKHNLYTKKDLNRAVKTSIIAVIGPGVNVLFLGMSMCALLGSGITYMRLGVIGTPMLELMNAQQAAALIDFKLGVDEMTPSMLTYIVFCMAFAVSGYVISPIFTLPGLDKLTMSSSEKKKKNGFAMKGISAASTGALVYMGLGYFNSIPTALAYVAGFTASAVVTFFIKSKGIKWLAPWNMAICMVVGMAAGQMSAMFIG